VIRHDGFEELGLGVHTQHCECPAHARGQRELEGLAAVRSGARVVGDLGSHFSHRFAAPGLIRRHILHHAAETPLYGSWMIEELREHGYEISPGALYPMLHGLAHKGYLKVRPEGPGKRARRLYRIDGRPNPRRHPRPSLHRRPRKKHGPVAAASLHPEGAIRCAPGFANFPIGCRQAERGTCFFIND
jgi:hypothetical protein